MCSRRLTVTVEEPEEPIIIPMEFIHVATGDKEMFEFQAVADPGARGVLAISGMIQIVDGRRVADLNGLLMFFREVLVDDKEYDRFYQMIERKDLVIPMDTLAEIYGALVEEYTGRPLALSNTSAAGPSSTGRTSTRSASSIAVDSTSVDRALPDPARSGPPAPAKRAGQGRTGAGQRDGSHRQAAGLGRCTLITPHCRRTGQTGQPPSEVWVASWE